MQNKMNVPEIDSKLNEVQMLEIGHSSSAFPGKKAQEQYEDSNARNGTREHMEIQVGDMVSALPETPNLNREDLPRRFLGNPTTEDQEGNQQAEIGLPRMASSTCESPIDIEAVELKIGFKVSCWVTAISATGIISVLVGYIGNRTSLTHKLLFKACMLSLCGSFISGAALFLLTIIHPNILRLIPTVKVVTWISVGLMTLTVGLGTCILLRTS